MKAGDEENKRESKKPGEIIQNWFRRFNQLIKDDNPRIKVDNTDSRQFLAVFRDTLYLLIINISSNVKIGKMKPKVPSHNR